MEPLHRVVDALLGLRALLLRDEEVLLALRLLDLRVQLPQRVLELLRLGAVVLPLRLQLERVLGVLLPAHERLAREVVAALADREPRPPLPLLRRGARLLELRPQLAFVGDRDRHLLLRLGELAAHVLDNRGEHLLGVFGPSDEVVEIRSNQPGKTVQDTHGVCSFPVLALQSVDMSAVRLSQ